MQVLHGLGVSSVAPLLAYELAGPGQRTVYVGIAQTVSQCLRVLVSLALTSTSAAAHPAVLFFVLAAIQGAVMVIAGRPGGGGPHGWVLCSTAPVGLQQSNCRLTTTK